MSSRLALLVLLVCPVAARAQAPADTFDFYARGPYRPAVPRPEAITGYPAGARDAARSYIESVGGKLHGFWYAFGEYDAYTLWDAPGNVAMAAVSIAISGGGALSKFETTALLTGEETLEALGQVETIRYRPPGE